MPDRGGDCGVHRPGFLSDGQVIPRLAATHGRSGRGTQGGHPGGRHVSSASFPPPSDSCPRLHGTMFPLRDDNPTEIVPFFTMGLILASLGVWVGVQGGGFDPAVLRASVCEWGVIPGQVTGAPSSQALPPGLECGEGGGPVTLLTSMFLHGGWAHLIGNLWFLWIFGNNVEDSMGHMRFIAFYLLSGLAGAGLQVVSDPGSSVPMVGASGAISGVMGAYIVLYPRVSVHLLVPIFIFITTVRVPAFMMLGYWLVLQLLGGLFVGGPGGGVAFWAHVGGFVAGMVLIFVFKNETYLARHPYYGWGPRGSARSRRPRRRG
jgi:membrane associated rhomboid family serine protease